ncbi:EAL domain-containing protein [Paraburkholderia caffeinilytica]|uniref:EAL domain-containing protein n=1 Tax=Paraburkholderia caffeinilytica TaxID=1761016 RepID=UPI003D9FF210
MGLAVVAEGVETRELADWLAAIGCDMGQGSLWSSAVPPHTLLEMKTHARESAPTVVQLHNRRVNERVMLEVQSNPATGSTRPRSSRGQTG